MYLDNNYYQKLFEKTFLLELEYKNYGNIKYFLDIICKNNEPYNIEPSNIYCIKTIISILIKDNQFDILKTLVNNYNNEFLKALIGFFNDIPFELFKHLTENVQKRYKYDIKNFNLKKPQLINYEIMKYIFDKFDLNLNGFEQNEILFYIKNEIIDKNYIEKNFLNEKLEILLPKLNFFINTYKYDIKLSTLALNEANEEQLDTIFNIVNMNYIFDKKNHCDRISNKEYLLKKINKMDYEGFKQVKNNYFNQYSYFNQNKHNKTGRKLKFRKQYFDFVDVIEGNLFFYLLDLNMIEKYYNKIKINTFEEFSKLINHDLNHILNKKIIGNNLNNIKSFENDILENIDIFCNNIKICNKNFKIFVYLLNLEINNENLSEKEQKELPINKHNEIINISDEISICEHNKNSKFLKINFNNVYKDGKTMLMKFASQGYKSYLFIDYIINNFSDNINFNQVDNNGNNVLQIFLNNSKNGISEYNFGIKVENEINYIKNLLLSNMD